MASMALIVLILHIGQYLKQKGLAIIVIRKHISEQSQIQFKQYLQELKDPTFILTSSDKKVVFCNSIG